MEHKKINAIIPSELLNCVEQRLENLGIKGLTVTSVMSHTTAGGLPEWKEAGLPID